MTSKETMPRTCHHLLPGESLPHHLDKVVRLGTGKTRGGRSYSVYCKIKVSNGRLSITGVEGPLPSGNCLGSCGQIDMHLEPLETFAPGWDQEKFSVFLYIWQQWHLNDMRAECSHQRQLGWTLATHKGQTCPVCGYKIGTKWLAEPLPKEVVVFLASLPDADRKPAWV